LRASSIRRKGVQKGKGMYRVSMIFGPEKIAVETQGVNSPETFLEFITQFGAMLPRYIVDFFDEHVQDEHQTDFLVSFLISFIRTYMDVAELEMTHLKEFVPQDNGTVH
jgi:hypothetical protein